MAGAVGGGKLTSLGEMTAHSLTPPRGGGFGA
jgi:hypothetical protein